MVIAHNILLIALREGFVKPNEVTSFRNDDDHVIYNVYLPLAKKAATLTPHEKLLYRRVLQHAEQLGLIKPGQAFVVDVAVDIRMDIQRECIEFFKVIEQIAQRLGILEEHTRNLDHLITNLQLDSRTAATVCWG